MIFNPDIHRRRSIRFQGYDYSQAGAYFITICTQNRECMFGEIVDRKMVLNHAGNMIQTVWDEIPIHYAGIETDEFVVMPNHIHGIIIITRSVVVPTVGAGPRACPFFMVAPVPALFLWSPLSCPCPRACPTPGQPGGLKQGNHGLKTGQPRGVAPTMTMTP